MKNIIKGLEESVRFTKQEIEDYKRTIKGFEEHIEEKKERISESESHLIRLNQAVDILKRELGEKK